MIARLALLAVALIAPAQALEVGEPDIHFEPDCSALLTLRVATEPAIDPERARVEIASPPTYRKIGKAYPPWVGSAKLERIRNDGEERVRIRGEEPLPPHPSDLVLVISEGHELPVFYTLNLPSCVPAGATREVVRGDTLLEIALDSARGQKVDPYALMLAIQLHNRHAFIHDNINLVRAGAELYIPSPTEVALLELSRQWMIDEVRFQNEWWRKWRQDGTIPPESPTLRERRLRLMPIEEPADSATAKLEPPSPPAPKPTRAAPDEFSATETVADAAASEPPSAPMEEGETERARTDERETPPAMMEIESEGLASLAVGAPSSPDRAAAPLAPPWPGILAATGLLLLAYLLALVLRRARHDRIIRQSVGDIPDPARRASSALDLAYARVETNQREEARSLLRLVRAEGTRREREEAKKLERRISSS